MDLRLACFSAQSCQSLDLNFQVPDEEEEEESVSEDEAEPGMFFNAPNSVPIPGELEISIEVGSPPSLVGASPSDSHDLESRTTEAAHSPTSDV